MKKIGILGGGQLGMLLAQSIVRLGAEACVYDPDPEAPACRAVKHSVNADWHDKKALSAFIAGCDRVTYEFENVPFDCLADLNQPMTVFPSLDVLKITQNRIHEKEFLRKQGLPHVPYIVATNLTELKSHIGNLKFPVIAKSTTGGYDGKGQIYLQSAKEFEERFSNTDSNLLLSWPIIVEQAIDLHMEVSCITGRSLQGQEIVFPIFENMHHNHILDTTIMPARLCENTAKTIQALARKASAQLGVTGLLCTEFFIGHRKNRVESALPVDEFELYINEFAPRPHNSGHVTISGCTANQFDVLAQILLDMPLSTPALINSGNFCMANMLGDIWLKQGTNKGDKLNLTNLFNHKELMGLIIYGKKEARSGRKMGHLVTWSDEAQQALKTAKLFREELERLKATE